MRVSPVFRHLLHPPTGVRITRRIPSIRISERFVGMRTAGVGLVRGRAVGADDIPIRFERRSASALPMGKPADWLLLSAATCVAVSRLPFRLLSEQRRAAKIDSGREASMNCAGCDATRFGTPD